MRIFVFLGVLFFQTSSVQAPAADLRVPLPPKRSPATKPVICEPDGTGLMSCSIMVPEKPQVIGGPLK